MLSFDAHNVIKELVADGLKETVAEKIVRTITTSKSSDMDKLPSKEQLLAVEKQLDNVAKHVSAVEKDVENFKDNFATKADLTAVENKLSIEISNVRTEIANTKTELKTEIANTKIEMLKWYIATSITIVIVITGVLFKLLGH